MRLKSVIVTMALGASVAIGGVSSAEAALSQCTGAKTCLWGNNDYQWYLAGKPNNRGLSQLSGEANNEMDSWANLSTSWSKGYDDPTPDGTSDGCQHWAAVTSDDNVSPLSSDEVSSWRTNGGSC